jgi:stringent starvation protein B
MSVRVPIPAVLAIYARETGQGMIFADEDQEPPSDPAGAADTATPTGDGDSPPKPPAGGGRARLKVVK